MTFPLCVCHCKCQRFSTATWARQLLSDPIRWMWCSANFIRKAPALITSLTLISPVLRGARGHCLMSFRVESGGLAEAEMKVVQESYTRRTQTHKRTRLTTSALPCRPFSAADGHSPPLTQRWLFSSLAPLSLPRFCHPSGQPAPPREIPKECWSTLLSPRSQSDCWVIPVYSYVLRLQRVSVKKGTVLSVKPRWQRLRWMCTNTLRFSIPASAKMFLINL